MMDNSTRGIWLDVMNELRRMRTNSQWQDDIESGIQHIADFVDEWGYHAYHSDSVVDNRASTVRLIALCMRFLQDTPEFQPDPAARYAAEATRTDDALFGVHDAIISDD